MNLVLQGANSDWRQVSPDTGSMEASHNVWCHGYHWVPLPMAGNTCWACSVAKKPQRLSLLNTLGVADNSVKHWSVLQGCSTATLMLCKNQEWLIFVAPKLLSPPATKVGDHSKLLKADHPHNTKTTCVCGWPLLPQPNQTSRMVCWPSSLALCALALHIS